MATPTFTGRGILRPFVRDQKNDLANTDGEALLIACVGQVLGTRADTPTSAGELPFRTEFGSRLHMLRHRNVGETTDLLAVFYCEEALAAWEPRVQVTTVRVIAGDKPRTRRVFVRFVPVDIRGAVLGRELESVVDLGGAS